MRRLVARRALLLLAPVLVTVTIMAAARRATAGAAASRADVERERLVREADIAFFEERVARDAVGAADRAMLAGLYLQRSRERGDPKDFAAAEHWARESLALRGGRNARALLVLASSLLAQHRFAEARRWAESLVTHAPEPSHRALLGEIQLELGDYAAARRTFAGLLSERENLAVAPRLARWHELEGRPELARTLLVEAAALARRRGDLPREQRAWFELRIADLALRYQRFGEAERANAAGLAANPGDPRHLGLAVRIAAARGDWDAALRAAGPALNAGPDIATLALIGDVHAALGRCGEARRHWDRAEQAYAANPEPYARQWTLFRLQHAIALDSTRVLLEREIRGRPDALGWQLLALARRHAADSAGASDAETRARAIVPGGRAFDPVPAGLAEARERCAGAA